MKPVAAKDRRVVNIKDANFTPYDPEETGEKGTSFLKLNPDMPPNLGFYIYKMEPGANSCRTAMAAPKNFMSSRASLKIMTDQSTKPVMWFGLPLEASIIPTRKKGAQLPSFPSNQKSRLINFGPNFS